MTRKKIIKPLTVFSLFMCFGMSISLSACNTNQSSYPTPTSTEASATQSPQSENPTEQRVDATILKVPGVSNSDPLKLLQSSQLKEELKLTDEQISQLKQLQKDLLADIEKIKSEPLPKANEKPNNQGIEQQRINIQERVESILKPEQITRAKEIFLQLYGYGPFTYQFFTSDLKLTPEQDEKFNDLARQSIFNIHKGWKQLTGSQEEKNKTLIQNVQIVEQIVIDTNKQAVALLTPEQQKTLEKLKGKEFKLDINKLKSGL